MMDAVWPCVVIVAVGGTLWGAGRDDGAAMEEGAWPEPWDEAVNVAGAGGLRFEDPLKAWPAYSWLGPEETQFLGALRSGGWKGFLFFPREGLVKSKLSLSFL